MPPEMVLFEYSLRVNGIEYDTDGFEVPLDTSIGELRDEIHSSNTVKLDHKYDPNDLDLYTADVDPTTTKPLRPCDKLSSIDDEKRRCRWTVIARPAAKRKLQGTHNTTTLLRPSILRHLSCVATSPAVIAASLQRTFAALQSIFASSSLQDDDIAVDALGLLHSCLTRLAAARHRVDRVTAARLGAGGSRHHSSGGPQLAHHQHTCLPGADCAAAVTSRVPRTHQPHFTSTPRRPTLLRSLSTTS